MENHATDFTLIKCIRKMGYPLSLCWITCQQHNLLLRKVFQSNIYYLKCAPHGKAGTKIGHEFNERKCNFACSVL